MPSSAKEASLVEEFRRGVQAAADKVCARIKGYIEMGAERAVRYHRQGMTKECAIQCAVRTIVCLILQDRSA